MIVESMSYEEICREYDKIHVTYFPRVQSKLDKYGEACSKIRRFLLKHRTWENVLFAPITYQVDNDTIFYSIPLIHDLYTFKKVGPTAVTFITYLNKHGMNALVRGNQYDDEYFFITSHFFNRYIERFLNSKFSKAEAIAEFFANNGSFMMTSHPTPKHPHSLIGSANDVVFFAEKIADKISVMKTCITRQMLYDDQSNFTEQLDKIVTEFDVEREMLMELITHNRIKYHHISFI